MFRNILVASAGAWVGGIAGGFVAGMIPVPQNPLLGKVVTASISAVPAGTGAYLALKWFGHKRHMGR